MRRVNGRRLFTTARDPREPSPSFHADGVAPNTVSVFLLMI